MEISRRESVKEAMIGKHKHKTQFRDIPNVLLLVSRTIDSPSQQMPTGADGGSSPGPRGQQVTTTTRRAQPGERW